MSHSQGFRGGRGRWFRCGVAALPALAAAVLAACRTSPNSQPAAPAPTVDTRVVDEGVIRSVDAAWTKAAEAKDIAGTTAVYADNAVLMAPGGPATTGKDAIVKGMTGMMADKNFALKFGPTKIEV